MSDLQKKIEELAAEAFKAFAASLSEETLYQSKVHYLGKKGVLTDILKEVGRLSPAERPLVGVLVNRHKDALESLYQSCVQKLKNAEVSRQLQSQKIDVTLPGIYLSSGSLHPITQMMAVLKSVFRRMGFDTYEGPEIESDYYNFEALNIPQNHPARDMQDTFYFSPEVLLRTHTSPVQIRTMKDNPPPIAMIAPGTVYRCDSDVSHTPMFHQIEGLVVDQGINLGHLKGVIQTLLNEIFEADIAVRFRPSYFPFTEPSAEVDIGCVICNKKGCRVCKQTGWLEVMGCGMVHPKVFASCDVDSEKFSGFAFGMGVERIAMLKYGINDIRLFFENDHRFLRQF